MTAAPTSRSVSPAPACPASSCSSPRSRTPGVLAEAAIHGYTTAFWIAAGIFAVGAVLCGALMRPGVPRVEAGAAPALAH